jgi:predicted 3-demethylubiquinone-9 3-methyltransferase (glyoxalase superfamily)
VNAENTICLWFDTDAEAAARFYAATFPNSEVREVHKAPGDYPSIKDRWGLSWQITPRTLTEAMAAGGAEAKRAFAAMMKMQKIDVATVDAARRG